VPSLFELITAPSSLVVLAIYAALLLWEALLPARKLPVVKHWHIAGLAAFAAYFLISSYLPYVWAEQLAAWQLFDLTHLNVWAGAAVGLFTYETGLYFWHRTMHRTGALWRSFHQMHHSAERIDVTGAFWFSPLDMIGWTLVMSLAFAVIGLPPQAATPAILFISFLAIFQHTNVRTPRWLGYFVQRPESHSLHHERGVHRDNYSDLPVFDMIFGSFRNPPRYAPDTGFWQGASSRVGDMLLLRDVSTPSSR
jgi:sterol desaturase/sphingolipid hydroxylase (fatty acid hydroxylase superfamily)